MAGDLNSEQRCGFVVSLLPIPKDSEPASAGDVAPRSVKSNCAHLAKRIIATMGVTADAETAAGEPTRAPACRPGAILNSRCRSFSNLPAIRRCRLVVGAFGRRSDRCRFRRPWTCVAGYGQETRHPAGNSAKPVRPQPTSPRRTAAIVRAPCPGQPVGQWNCTSRPPNRARASR